MRKEDPSHVDSGWDDDDEFDPQSLIGEIIDENTPSALRLNRLLGAGSYAFVYSAVPVSSSSNASSLPVAVKCLFKQGLASDQLELQRTEADILRRLGGHPNIVKLISVSESSTFLFLVLDRCDEDLLEVIMSGKVCATGSFYDISDEMDMVETVKDLFSQLLDAVEFCHANGIYHRDIKPENVLAVFSSTGEISLKLTDFGLASFNRHPMDYGVGSVSYTSPESLAGPKPLNNWAQVGHDAIANDTWSLGIVLFNLLTSKNPWYSATAEDSAY
ncbi:kinase-like domain-containing protein, partial [Zopfochytrium polystomum]